MFNNCADIKIVIYRYHNYEKMSSKLVDIMVIIIYVDFSLKVYVPSVEISSGRVQLSGFP